ncbi:MAG: TerC family protein [Ignavibacteriaceae bacterium]|nr:TerC family protein [Ignavibacteriaceae bacterium]
MEFDLQIIISLLTLVVLEIVLGIDNIVFISILTGKLPASMQEKARIIGLSLAMITRVLLLLSLTLLMKLTYPLFTVFGNEISGKDLIVISGGIFLLTKSTHEIHDKLEGEEGEANFRIKSSFAGVMIQILLLDIVFSLDSVITAIGMANQIWVMVTAVVVAVIFMLFLSGKISAFVNNHPTVKMLALSFLLLIGITLIAEGFDQHIPKGYIYFSMAFSLFVEMLNLRAKGRKAAPVKLRNQLIGE